MSTRRAFLQSALFLPTLLSAQAFAQDAKTAPFADFENGAWGDWTTEGEAFGASPATDALFPGKIRGFGGNGFVCTLHPKKGNAAIGKAVSREFTIEKPFITFKIGGGAFPGAACLNLVVDGQVTHTATGNGTATLADASWDVSALVGKKAHLEIVDNTTSNQRGYVMVDDIRFHERIDFGNLPYQEMVTQMADRWRRDYGLPGVWCALIKDGRVQACVASGTRKVGEDLPASVENHLPVGSVSKVITGSMIAFFVADGTIKYETTIGEVFPELTAQYPNSPLLKATLRNLMTHSAGLPRGPDVSFNVTGPEYRLNTLKKYVGDERCKPVNTIARYSNQGVPIAVAMVEKRSGTTFETWLYGPIGRKIGLSNPHQINTHPNETFPHILENGQAKLRPLEPIKPYAFAPQGAYSLTLNDLCAFAQFTLTNSAGLPGQIYNDNIIGPTQGLPTQSIAEDGTIGPNRERTDAGWAFNDGMRYLYHNGQISGHYAELWVSPKTRQALAFYTNCIEGNSKFKEGTGKDIYALRFQR